MKVIRVGHSTRKIQGRIRLPLSKSMSNRALIMQALSTGKIEPLGLSHAEDTRLLENLLAAVSDHQGEEPALTVDCGNAGTVFRFLTALLAVTPGRWLLTGSGRMKERPVGPLAEALRALGARIEYLEVKGFPPLMIQGMVLRGKRIPIEPGISSQFLSALLMIGPLVRGGIELELQGKATSWPYVLMTLGMMREAGLQSSVSGKRIRVPEQPFTAAKVRVEHDWSAAAFWYEMVALSEEGDILLEGLSRESRQGDAVLPRLYEPLGVSTTQERSGIRIRREKRPAHGFTHDFTGHPDLAQALAATCAGRRVKAGLSGLESLRIKETDRLAALRNELEKTGTEVIIHGGAVLSIDAFPKKLHAPARFSTYGDHRMAMALAPLALVTGGVTIEDPEVVAKSYPGFWDDLRSAGFEINVEPA